MNDYNMTSRQWTIWLVKFIPKLESILGIIIKIKI